MWVAKILEPKFALQNCKVGGSVLVEKMHTLLNLKTAHLTTAHLITAHLTTVHLITANLDSEEKQCIRDTHQPVV